MVFPVVEIGFEREYIDDGQKDMKQMHGCTNTMVADKMVCGRIWGFHLSI